MADDARAGAPRPVTPPEPTVDPTELQRYFRSIEEPFRDTLEGLKRDRRSEKVVGSLAALFVFSLFPVLPYLVSLAVSRYAGPQVVRLWVVRFQVGSFWFWWPALFVFTLAIALVAGWVSGASAEEKRDWLSPSQMRFAYCYGAVDEIAKYKTNQLRRHTDAALEYLDKTEESLFPLFPRVFPPWGPSPLQHPPTETDLVLATLAGAGPSATEPPKWYRLQPETETILRSFREFRAKLRDRLKDRKDLPAVQSALTHLAAYRLMEIPELSGASTEEGVRSLLAFAAQMAALPSYRSEEARPTSKQKLPLKLRSGLSRITVPFGHENQVVAFFAWLVLMFLLFGGGFYVTLRVFAVKVDSTVITTLVGGPILGALTAVAIPRVGKRRAAS